MLAASVAYIDTIIGAAAKASAKNPFLVGEPAGMDRGSHPPR
jgi:hypothetical protein